MRLLVTTIITFALTLGVLPSTAAARPQQAGKVSAELLADVSAIEPGKPFTVGVKFTIAPHWHIYWINPGESGEATSVKFDLPPGFTVGELKFPAPRVIRLPGPIISYGYENEVMLLATVTPPEELPASATWKLAAHAQWLECEDVCVPGDAKLSLQLPTSGTDSPANKELFSIWSRKIPVLMPGGHFVKSHATATGRDYELTVNWTRASKVIEFIPGPSDDVNFRDIDVQTANDHTVVRFRVEPLKGRAMPTKSIRCVVSYSDPPSDSPAGMAYDVPMSDNPSSDSTDKRSGK